MSGDNHPKLSRFIGERDQTLERVRVSPEMLETVYALIPPSGRKIAVRKLARALGRAALTNTHWAALRQLYHQGRISWEVTPNPRGRGLLWFFFRVELPRKDKRVRPPQDARERALSSQVVPFHDWIVAPGSLD